MALRIELEGEKPGFARLIAQKWCGSAEIDMLIQRNQDGYYLSNINQWGPEKHWHTVSGMTVENDKLDGLVGEWLVDSLLSQESQVRFLIQIRDSQNVNLTDGGVVNIAKSVLASAALDSSVAQRNNTTIVEESVKILDEPIEPLTENVEESINASVIEPETLVVEAATDHIDIETKPIKPKRKTGLIVLIIVVLLIILAGLVGYFLLSQKEVVSTATSQISECTLDKASDNDLAFIQQCLQAKPDTESILVLIGEAKKANRCNIAQRLYANQAQQNPTIAVTYAKEYDEKFYQNNSCFKADKETAIYWYETTLTNEPNNVIAKERLTALQK